MMKIRQVFMAFIVSTFLGCSEKNELGLCERVIQSASRENVVDELWMILKKPYENLDEYDTTIGPENSIRITANKELLVDNSLKFIDMNWGELGFLGDNHYILYYPSEIMELGDSKKNYFSKKIEKVTFLKVEIGNENIRIRLYPSQDSFSAEIECKRSNSASKKLTIIKK